MTQSIGAIRNFLLDRLVVMKKEINFHEGLIDIYDNEADVIESLNEKYNKAVEAYTILNGIIESGYLSDGDWADSDFFD